MIRAVFSRITGFMALAALLFAAGIILASRLPVMMYPQTQRPRIRVSISHPGVSAISFQNNYAEEFEPGLLGLDNLDTIESSYASDQSSFTLTFDWKIDRDSAIKDVESLMASLNSGLPEEIKDNYRVGSYQSENAGFLVMGITSNQAAPEQMFSMLSRSVESKLKKIDDVEEIGFFNVEDLSVDIVLRQSAMLPYGVRISDVETALREGLLPFPLGSIEESSRSYSVRFSREARGIKNIERIVVKKIGNRSITLGEIADISIEYVLPGNLFLADGAPVVQLNATPIEGGNVTQMTDDIMAVMEAARSDGLIPADSQFRIFLDPAKYIRRAISNVVRSALIGGTLAVFMVFLILGELRNTLIIAFSLPFTVVLSFILMYIFNVSLNLISLGGLALAVGMIVDSTIVVMENIHRLRVEHGVPENRLAWQEIVSAATDQVRAPVIASVLTSVLVFFPISFTAPLTNAILGDQALTVIFSLACSLFVALFLVPLVAYALYRPGSKQLVEDRPGHERLRGLARLSVPAMMRITAAYKKSLGFILRKKALAVLLICTAFGILALAVVLMLPAIPKEIISPPSSDRVVIFFRNFVDYPDSESVMEKALPDIEARIKKRLETDLVQTYANVRGRFNMIFVDLKSAELTNQAVAELQDEFPSSGNNYFNVMPWDPAELPLPRTAQMQISVYGPDEAQKTAILEEIQDIANDTGLYQRVYSRPAAALADELILTPRDDVLSGFPDITENSLAAELRRILSGTFPVTMKEDGFDVDVEAHFPEEDIDSREKLRNFLIPLASEYVPLKHLLNFSEEQTVSEIYAVDGEPGYRVYGRILDKVPESVRSEYERTLGERLEAELNLPSGYSWSFDNPQIEMDRSINSLYIALAISILLIYLLLCFQFNSLWIPLVILVSIPMGFIGVIVSLVIFKSSLSLNSMLGTILLGGIVVNNSIIIIDFWLKSRHRYSDGFQALEDVAAIRFQPVVITTLTTILGMIPIAAGLGEGSNILQPLGIAVSGGLLISSLLTLYIVPSLLSLSIPNKHSETAPLP